MSTRDPCKNDDDDSNPTATDHPGEMLLEEFLKLLGVTQTIADEKMGISLNRLKS